jgi:hypothetical protein
MARGGFNPALNYFKPACQTGCAWIYEVQTSKQYIDSEGSSRMTEYLHLIRKQLEDSPLCSEHL